MAWPLSQEVQHPAWRKAGGQGVLPGLEPCSLAGVPGQEPEGEGVGDDILPQQELGDLLEAHALLDEHGALLAGNLGGHGEEAVRLPGAKAARRQEQGQEARQHGLHREGSRLAR